MDDNFTRPSDLTALSDIDVQGLSALALEAKSIDYDFAVENWAEIRGSGGYVFIEPCECEHCHVIAFCSGGNVECENENCPEHGSTISEECGPMMNYYYPLHRELDEEEIANLVNLPLVYVEIDESPGLALSGGGMDLSWEICEAFIRLGFLPPANFASLPAMSGRGGRPGDKVIMAACRLTAQAIYEAGESSRAYILRKVQECETLAAERGDR